MPQRFLEQIATWFGSIRLDFGPEPHQKHLTLTFNFLTGILGLLVLLTAIWSVAAGVLQSGRLIAHYRAIFQQTAFDSEWMQWAALVPAAVIYALKAFGVSMLVCLSAASIGAIVGFLFGVPRPISESGLQPAPANAGALVASSAPAVPEALPGGARGPAAAVPAQSEPDPSVVGATGALPGNVTGTPPGSGVGAAPGAVAGAGLGTMTSAAPSGRPSSVPGWQASTNLTQISDWLTKIIVGVSLVEAHRITGAAGDINAFVSSQLFEGLIGTQLVLPALMLAGLVFGFLYSYLFTQLFLATMMAQSAAEVGHANDIVLNRGDAAILSSGSAGRVISARAPYDTSSRGRGDSAAEASAVQKTAARNVVEAVPLDRVSDPNSIKVWARAQAILDNWAPAVSGYTKLLSVWRTPELLSEAARVFNAANDPATARALINEAAQGRDATTADARSRITFDAANVALYDEAPGGYRRALSLLDEQAMRTDDQGGLHILRACANGQRLQYEGADLNDEGKAKIRKLVFDDLQRGIGLSRERNGPWVARLLGSGGDVDDDLKPFRDDPAFQALVAAPAGG